MIFATDVYYQNEGAIAAGVLFEDWTDRDPIQEVRVEIDQVADYEPGQFYKRELPCLLKLLDELASLPTTIVVDGYVYLNDAGKPGLGRHLYDALNGNAIVIGVAKTRFKDVPIDSEVLRGTSQKPLYVTAVGMDLAEAKQNVAKMQGEFRLPTMLKLVDQLGRRSD